MTNTNDPPTSTEFHQHLVKLGLEAFDRSIGDPRPLPLRQHLEEHLRERMAQAATVYATVLDASEPELPPMPSQHKPGPSEPLPWQYELDFRRAWAALPPLVRASVASGVVDWLEQQRSSLQRGEKIETHHGLFRRIAVTRNFIEAYGVIVEFCAALTREADEEAVARGIDADVTSGATWAVKK